MKKRTETLLIIFLNAMCFFFFFVLALAKNDMCMAIFWGFVGVGVFNGMEYLENKFRFKGNKKDKTKCDMCNERAKVIIDFVDIDTPIGKHRYCLKHLDVYAFVRNSNREAKESLKNERK